MGAIKIQGGLLKRSDEECKVLLASTVELEQQVSQLKQAVVKIHSGHKGPMLPPGIATEITPRMKARQTKDPKKWRLSLNKWISVIEHCMEQPEYKKLKKEKGHVTMYDLNNLFVKPWTAGTGCSLAVLMSDEDDERDAEFIFSHAWGEGVDECLQAVKKYQRDNNISLETPVWFCVFANYQAEDRHGPTIRPSSSWIHSPRSNPGQSRTAKAC